MQGNMSIANDTSMREKKPYVEHTRDTISMFRAMLEKLLLVKGEDKGVDLSEVRQALEESIESMEAYIKKVNEKNE